jgi:hypothetical protein
MICFLLGIGRMSAHVLCQREPQHACVCRCPVRAFVSDSVREGNSLWHAGLPACSALGLIGAVVSAWLPSCHAPNLVWGPCGQAFAGAAWWAVHTHTQWVCAVVAALAPV